jgi:hypothetical protein
MNSQHDKQAIALLHKDPELSIFWKEAPQAILMPFGQGRKRHYLAIIVFLIDQAVNLDTLTVICSRAVKLLRSKGVLDSLDGVELLPCRLVEGNTKRILRLSILAKALKRSEEISVDDLKNSSPAEGVTSYIYEKTLK